MYCVWSLLFIEQICLNIGKISVSFVNWFQNDKEIYMFDSLINHFCQSNINILLILKTLFERPQNCFFCQQNIILLVRWFLKKINII